MIVCKTLLSWALSASTAAPVRPCGKAGACEAPPACPAVTVKVVHQLLDIVGLVRTHSVFFMRTGIHFAPKRYNVPCLRVAGPPPKH